MKDSRTIRQALLEGGLSPKYQGFDYLVDIIMMVMESGDFFLTQYYEELSIKYSVNKEVIYQDIRYMLSQISYKNLIIYDDIVRGSFPTNKEFITFFCKTIDLFN